MFALAPLDFVPPIPAAQLAAAWPTMDLTSLCKTARKFHDLYDALGEQPDGFRVSADWSGLLDVTSKTLARQVGEMVDRAAAWPATTLEEIRAKAALVVPWCRHDDGECDGKDQALAFARELANGVPLTPGMVEQARGIIMDGQPLGRRAAFKQEDFRADIALSLAMDIANSEAREDSQAA